MYQIEELRPIIEDAINSSSSMREASSKTTMNFQTFRKYAIKLNLYRPNQSGKGIPKSMPSIPLIDILEGKYPGYRTSKLAKRLLKEKIKEHKCENCKKRTWMGGPIPLELDHIDGNPYNHVFTNLQLICPNCHALTPTYRGRNNKFKKVTNS